MFDLDNGKDKGRRAYVRQTKKKKTTRNNVSTLRKTQPAAKRRGPHRQWSENDMAGAVNEAQSQEMTLRMAAKTFKVSIENFVFI